MTTRIITTDLQNIIDTGWAYGTVFFTLKGAQLDGETIFPQQVHKIITDANGESTDSFAVPATGAFLYEVTLPDGSSCDIQLESGASITMSLLLSTWCDQVVLPPLPDTVYYRLDTSNNPLTGKVTQTGIHEGIVPVSLTTGQRNGLVSPTNGAMIYNSTTEQLETYQDSWQSVSYVKYDSATDSYNLDITADGQTQNLGHEVIISAQNDNGTTATTLNPKVFLSIGAVSGSEFFHSTVKPIASDIVSGSTFGLNTTDMAVAGRGKVLIYGMLNDVNTAAWELNDILYIDPTTRGEITVVQDTVNAWVLGTVLKVDATEGIIFVNTISSTNLAVEQGISTPNSFWMTGGDIALSAGTFYESLLNDRGLVASVTEAVAVPDDTKIGLTQDHVSQAFDADGEFQASEVSGTLEYQVGNNQASDKVHLEVYRADNDGNVIDSGFGVPVGDLGVKPLIYYQSPVLTTPSNTPSIALLTGVVTEDFTILEDQRLVYHFLFEKVGTQGGNKTYTAYFGSDHGSRVFGSTQLTSDNILNASNVVGETVSDALDTLETDIGTNTTNIGTNTTNIGTNVTNIGTNATNIGTNASDITALTGVVDENANNLHYFDGSFLETHEMTVSSDGVTIFANLEKTGTGDLTMRFNDGLSVLDCTPIISVELTAGTDPLPVMNFIYVPFSTKVLTAAIAWPSGEHIRVGKIYVQTPATVVLEGGVVERWNDHTGITEDGRGHGLHVAERLRQLFGQWDSGTESVLTIVPDTIDDLFLSVTSGFVYQLHLHSFTGMDMSTGDSAYIANHPTNAFEGTTNLNNQLTDANNVSMSNKYYTLVVWGANSSGIDHDYAMVNLPNGSYNNQTRSLSDPSGFTVYDIPKEFQNIGFLVGQFTLKHDSGSDTWTLINYIDLRGKQPNTTAGSSTGSSSITTYLGLVDTPLSYVGEALKIGQVNAGETALEFTDSPTFDDLTVNGVLSGNIDMKLRDWFVRLETFMSTMVWEAVDARWVTSANLTWPDGSLGVYTLLVSNTGTWASSGWAGIDSWSATHVDSGLTITQPTITRNANGDPTEYPTPTVV